MRIGPDGMVVQWSLRAQEMFGRSAAQALGRPAISATGGATAELRVRPQILADGSVVWVVREAPIGSEGELGAAILEQLFVQSPYALHVLDRQLRVVRANATAEAMRRPASEPINGLILSEAYHFEDPEQQEAAFLRVLDSGDPLVERLVGSSLKPESPPDRAFLVSAFRLQDLHDAVLGLAAVVADVTESEKRRRRIAVLSRSREKVGRTLDVVSICQDLADVVVPAFADLALLDVVEAIMWGNEPAEPTSAARVPLRRTASAGGLDMAGKWKWAPGELHLFPDRTPFALSLEDLRARLVSVDEPSDWLNADTAIMEALRSYKVQSALVVPLERGTVLGLLCLGRCRDSPRFDQHDLALAMDLAAYTTLCLDNARRYVRERAMAATVQRRLLPQRPAAHTGLDTAYAYLASGSTGGSWFDIIPLSSSRSLFVIGRVAGEGMYAATSMGQLRTAIHTLAALDLEADDLLARLNDTVLRLAEESAQPDEAPAHGESLTAAYSYALYDPVSCTCIAGRSGLPGVFLACPDGTVTTAELPDGPLLGSTEVAPFATTTLDVSEGTVLALATPALLETVGTERFQQLLSHGGASMQELCDKIVYASRLGQPPEGEGILVLALANRLPTDRTTVWSVEADPRAPASARARTRSWLTERHVPEETVFAAEVVVSELVTNAVHYGAPPLSLRLILDRTLTAEVTDTSATSPHLRHARATDEGGRGLFIIAQLADRWGTRPTPGGGGKTIWAEMPPCGNHTELRPRV